MSGKKWKWEPWGDLKMEEWKLPTDFGMPWFDWNELDSTRAQMRAVWQAVIDKTKIGGAIPVTFEIEDLHTAFVVRAVAQVPSTRPVLMSIPPGTHPEWQSAGTMVGIAVTAVLPLTIQDEAAIVKFLISLARGLYLHELYEQLMVGDARPLDPHDPDAVKALCATEMAYCEADLKAYAKTLAKK